MKLTVLMENTACRTDMVCTHGLSFYIESGGKTILFDMGPGAQFAENAQTLGVDLAAVDYAVLSHGHYDHGGGMDVFFRRNQRAPVFVREGAFATHTDKAGKSISLDMALKTSKRICFTGESCQIDDHAQLFSAVQGDAFVPEICKSLLEYGAPDRFAHEQDLLLEENGKLFLFGGCAHCGLVNILERATQVAGRAPDYVFSGMHLAVGESVPDDFTRALGEKLKTYPCKFYTCHCTGLQPYAVLKTVLGDQLDYASAGSVIVL
ncbi:MAG: MBL fold metallo-hydrolase [Oscillospiraceae bacterium]|nr:MBL fold metallo-hydrolase [Oscillospiraceae bacterium]